MQFGELLADDRVIDSRGVISLPYGSGKTPVGAGKAIKGYKVRKWRLWGETGKQYHHYKNTRREGGDKGSLRSNADQVHELATHSTRPPIAADDIIDEVVYFSWISPFTHRTRDYRFQYCGIDFYWKGTGTVKEGRTCGSFLHFNHLKLVARIPLTGDGRDEEKQGKSEEYIKPVRRSSRSILWQRSAPTFREICIAKYTSSLGKKKAGTLQMYDEALFRLMIDHNIPSDDSKTIELGGDVVSVKHTRLYDIIIATTMCMVIGEWQKRQWLKKIIELAAGEAGGNAGGS